MTKWWIDLGVWYQTGVVLAGAVVVEPFVGLMPVEGRKSDIEGSRAFDL